MCWHPQCHWSCRITEIKRILIVHQPLKQCLQTFISQQTNLRCRSLHFPNLFSSEEGEAEFSGGVSMGKKDSILPCKPSMGKWGVFRNWSLWSLYLWCSVGVLLFFLMFSCLSNMPVKTFQLSESSLAKCLWFREILVELLGSIYITSGLCSWLL